MMESFPTNGSAMVLHTLATNSLLESQVSSTSWPDFRSFATTGAASTALGKYSKMLSSNRRTPKLRAADATNTGMISPWLTPSLNPRRMSSLESSSASKNFAINSSSLAAAFSMISSRICWALSARSAGISILVRPLENS